MKIKVYADFEVEEIYSEEEFEVIFEEMLKDGFNNRCRVMNFEDWLEDNFSRTEIFNLSQEDKNQLLKEYRKDFKDFLIEDDYRFKEKIIEI